MDPTVDAILRVANPWARDRTTQRKHIRRRLPDPNLARSSAVALSAALDDLRKAHLVVGPRQAGKSTLVWTLLAESERPVLYVNCEEAAIREWCRSPTLVGADIAERLPEGGVVFFEEAQWLDEAGLLLKGLVDAHLRRCFVVTGSASFHLLSRTRESLAGRASRHQLWPFTLAEVARETVGLPPAVARSRVAELLERHLVVGGYPDAWTSDNPRTVLDALVGAFLLRDASDRFRVERPDALRTLLRLAAGQVGDLVNLTEWAQILGIAASTVADYLALLEETHVVRRVRPFIGGKRAELTKTPKIYLLDNGLRNALAGGFEPLPARADVGKLLESWIFSELHKRFPFPGGVRHWRTRNGAEVDFVVEPSPGRLVAFEVKAARGRIALPRSARSFIEAYRPARFVMVYRGQHREETISGTPVEWLPVDRWLERFPAIIDHDA